MAAAGCSHQSRPTLCAELQAVAPRGTGEALPPSDQVLELRKIEQLAPSQWQADLRVWRTAAEQIERDPIAFLEAGGFGPEVGAAGDRLKSESQRLCDVDPFSTSLALVVVIPTPAASLSSAAAAYQQFADGLNQRTNDLEAQINSAGSDLAQLHAIYRELASLRGDAANQLRAMSFPPEAAAEAEALEAALSAQVAILSSLSTASGDQLTGLQAQLDQSGSAVTKAAGGLRMRLGL